MHLAASSSAVDPEFRAEVLAGLAAPVRAIPARWLYDRRGSELFEAITQLPEYYLTRTEAALFERDGEAMAAAAGPTVFLVEFGSGSSAKTRRLIETLAPQVYVPIDISGDFLRDAAAALRDEFPGLQVRPVEANFMSPVDLPVEVEQDGRLGFFPGSTIGNMIPATAVDLLRNMRRTLGVGARLLIGMDRLKSLDILLPAYDDQAGVTAAFNLNLLDRINAELDGDIPVERFRHEVRWNDSLARIEMHLVARADLAFSVCGQPFAMAAGESIHTENSHKYGLRDARLLLQAGGWTIEREWTDDADSFCVLLAKAEPARFAP